MGQFCKGSDPGAQLKTSQEGWGLEHPKTESRAADLLTEIPLHDERLWPASGTQRGPLKEGKGDGGEDRRRINKNQLNPQFEQSK